MQEGIDWCLKKDLLKKIKPSKEMALKHLEKAKHNLKVSQISIREGVEDWAVSQLYYSSYHALLGLLFLEGYESKNHNCTLVCVEFLIEKEKTSLDKKDLAFIKTTEQMTGKDAKSLREEFQYGVETKVNKEILCYLLERTKVLIEKIEVIINE